MPDPADRQSASPPASPALPPSATLGPMITGFMVSQTIHVAARLGIADLLKDGAKSSDELARATATHAPSLHRMLRALAALGLLDEVEPGRFALTPLGGSLRTGVPGSLRNLALMYGGERMWQVWGNLLHSVRTGETAMRHLFGMGSFEYMARHPDLAAVFNEAMSEFTRQVAAAVLAVYDFSRFRTIVDVGGGNGTLVAMILAATPGLRGVIFDLPSGLAAAKSHLASAGIAERCQVVEGDFFKSVPDGGDAYMLKSIIHDWDDERSLVILENCRQAMPAHGTLLVLERVLPARVEAIVPHRQIVMSDLNMLVAAGGRERTDAQYRTLLASAGFTLTAIVPDRAPTNFSVLEAVPG